MNKNKAQTVIGIDVSKEKLDIYNTHSQKCEVINNDVRSIGSWLAKVRKNFEIETLALEPTGGYENKLTQLLCDKHVPTFAVHPNKLVNYKKSKGENAKTDKLDAKHIARYAVEYREHLKPILPQCASDKNLKEFVRTRQQLMDSLHRFKCHKEHDFKTKVVKRANAQVIRTLEKELSNMEQAIQDEIKNDEKKHQRFKSLQTIVGVGPVVACMVIAEIPELGQISHEQLSSLIGVAPFNQDSGKQAGPGRIRGGRARVRSKVYMAALSASTSNPKMKAVYERLIRKGKPPKVALVAVMRRMLRIMNAMARDESDYVVEGSLE